MYSIGRSPVGIAVGKGGDDLSFLNGNIVSNK